MRRATGSPPTMSRVPSALSLVLAASLLATPIAVRSDAPPPGGPSHRPATPHPAGSARAQPVAPEAAIIGDSYTAGANATSPGRGYAERLAHAMNWQHADIRGLPGAGYARPSVKGRRLANVVRRVVRRRPAVVVMVMGHNDWRVTPGLVERDAHRTLAFLHRRLPGSRIVVVGPIWQSGDPAPRVVATRDAIRRAERRIRGLAWVDPLAERWFTGDKRRHTGNAAHFISKDDNHPNDAGHAHIAKMLLRDLIGLGIAPSP
jgi:lysophospholipase L1-like esterase